MLITITFSGLFWSILTIHLQICICKPWQEFLRDTGSHSSSQVSPPHNVQCSPNRTQLLIHLTQGWLQCCCKHCCPNRKNKYWLTRPSDLQSVFSMPHTNLVMPIFIGPGRTKTILARYELGTKSIRESFRRRSLQWLWFCNIEILFLVFIYCNCTDVGAT